MNTRNGSALPQFVHDMLASPPRRGGGLNIWLYRTARVLHPYRDSNDIIELLRAATVGEFVRHGEIERAVKRSKQTAWIPGQPPIAPLHSPWPAFDAEKRRSVLREIGAGLVDLWELSPVKWADNEPHTEEVIDALFPGDPLLCAGKSQSDFDTRTREQWRGRLSKLELIGPNPMTARVGLTQEGKRSTHTLGTTGARRFLVIEQDRGTIDEQAAVILHLTEQGPLTLVVYSGSKSIHAWFYCLGQSEGRLRKFMAYAVTLGCDQATWTRSQFVRMPGGQRANGKQQSVYLFNPEAVK